MTPDSEETGHPLCPQCCHPYGETEIRCANCGFGVRSSPWNFYNYSLGMAPMRQPSLTDPPPPLDALAHIWSWAATIGITGIVMLIAALNSPQNEWAPVLISGAVALPISLIIGYVIRRMSPRKS